MKNNGDLIPVTKIKNNVFHKKFDNFDIASNNENELKLKINQYIQDLLNAI